MGQESFCLVNFTTEMNYVMTNIEIYEIYEVYELSTLKVYELCYDKNEITVKVNAGLLFPRQQYYIHITVVENEFVSGQTISFLCLNYSPVNV